MTALTTIRAAAVTLGAIGSISGAFYGMLNRQSRSASRLIRLAGHTAPRADGIYLPTGDGPLVEPLDRPPLRFAVLGDSLGVGVGVTDPEELIGVRLARGLAEAAGRPVVLDTYAVSGATSRELTMQVERAERAAPAVALVIIGANDIKLQMPLATSAALLGDAVTRLREHGAVVVVGTCPDLGAIPRLPQPLRTVARAWSHAFARLQRDAVLHGGGQALSIAELVSPEFLTQPDALFSIDQFHPSAAGYEMACAVLLPALCSAIGAGPGDDLVTGPAAASAERDTQPWAERLKHRVAATNRAWRRKVHTVAATVGQLGVSQHRPTLVVTKE